MGGGRGPKVPDRTASVRRRLLAWYRRHRRDLPWRRTGDPYAVWGSEIMLQQTTVAAAVPFFERWMKRFPTLADLARSDEEAVLTLWAGLGYYNRARNLHRAAKIVTQDHGGAVPRDHDALRCLPGIGRYTAGAIGSIAFGHRVPALDGNVSRVLARLFAVKEDIAGAVGQQILWEHAADLVQTRSPGDLNQALMELGALICLPTAPRCSACPLAPRCAGHRGGNPERFPTSPRRPETVQVTEVGAVIERDGRMLILRRPETGRMAGLWEFPHGSVRGDEPADAVESLVKDIVGYDICLDEPLVTIDHTFTHHQVTLHVWRGHPRGGRVHRRVHDDHRWATLDQLLRRPMATPQWRIVQALLRTAGGRQLDLVACSLSRPIDTSERIARH